MTQPGLWERYSDWVLCVAMLVGFAVALATVLLR